MLFPAQPQIWDVAVFVCRGFSVRINRAQQYCTRLLSRTMKSHPRWEQFPGRLGQRRRACQSHRFAALGKTRDILGFDRGANSFWLDPRLQTSDAAIRFNVCFSQLGSTYPCSKNPTFPAQPTCVRPQRTLHLVQSRNTVRGVLCSLLSDPHNPESLG